MTDDDVTFSSIKDSSSGRRWHARVTIAGTGPERTLEVTLKNEHHTWKASGESLSLLGPSIHSSVWYV